MRDRKPRQGLLNSCTSVVCRNRKNAWNRSTTTRCIVTDFRFAAMFTYISTSRDRDVDDDVSSGSGSPPTSSLEMALAPVHCRSISGSGIS